MHDAPSISELITAVQAYLESLRHEPLGGHAKFNAKVASNVLAIVQRELDQRPIADRNEVGRLHNLLGTHADTQTDLKTLNAALIDHIKTAHPDTISDELLAHLKETAIAQLNIDQPTYSGLKTAKDTLT